MRNIEIGSKQLRSVGFIASNAFGLNKNTYTFSILRNGWELWSIRTLKFGKVILVSLGVVSILILAILYFTSDKVKNAGNNEIWTKTDLSNTQYDFTSEVGNSYFINSKLKL